jgi:hypothetical protein
MEKPNPSSAIQLHQAPSFGATKGHFAHLPSPSLRMAFCGVSQSGKGCCILDLLLRHYRGCFVRIYLFSPTALLDKSWEPLKKYVEGEMGVDPDKEKWMFEEFDTKALQEQVDLQMKVAELAKTRGHKNIPQVLWVLDDMADDPSVLHSNSNLIASLAIKSRHYGGNLFLSTQRFRALANIIRVNLTAMFVWPAPNAKERKAIIEELAGHYSEKDIEEMLQHIARKPYAFLFADLKAKDPDLMFMDSLTSRIRVTK